MRKTWAMINRNAPAILVLVTVLGSILGGTAWVLGEIRASEQRQNEALRAVEERLLAEQRASEERGMAALEAAEERWLAERRASEERLLAAIRAGVDESAQETLRELTDLLGRHSHHADGQVVISVAPDGLMPLPPPSGSGQ